MNTNKHVIQYLNYYAAFPESPRFAVMVDGRWGIGKTHLIDAFLASVRTHDFQAVYVSLNGLKTSSEIDRELFRSMYDVLGNKYFEAVTGLAKTGLKWWQGISIDFDFLRLVNRYKAHLYVFDDLERCEMPIAETLGYINAFVEQGGRRVIIIANQKEIQDQEVYRRTREKVVGMTLVVRPEIDMALTTFLAKIRNGKIRSLLETKIDVIRTIHEQADLDNLRILQQALWDVERFLDAWEDRHRAHDAAVTAMLRLLLALSIEVRVGRLSEGDLRERHVSIVWALMKRDEAGPPTPLASARQRYPSTDLGSAVLTDDTLIALLFTGTVDVTAICRDLDASPYFASPEDEPAWRILWDGFDRTDAEVAAAQERMETEFAGRDYTVPGVILHVFGQRLRLSKIGALAIPLDQVISECRTYVDDLYATHRLDPSSPKGGPSAMRETGHGGLQIAASDTPEYKGLFRYLEERRAQVTADRFPAQAADLLVMLRGTPEEFIDQIASGRGQQSPFARVPVLAHIPADVFVAAVLSHRPNLQRQLLEALQTRYDYRALQTELAPEAAWAQSVRSHLVAASATMSAFGQHRMMGLLRQSLDQVPELKPSPSSASDPTDEP